MDKNTILSELINTLIDRSRDDFNKPPPDHISQVFSTVMDQKQKDTVAEIQELKNLEGEYKTEINTIPTIAIAKAKAVAKKAIMTKLRNYVKKYKIDPNNPLWDSKSAIQLITDVRKKFKKKVGVIEK